MPTIRRALILLVLAQLVACGGGGGSSPDGPSAPGDPPGSGPQNGPDILLSTDDPGAALSVVPDICCAGDRIYVVWYDLRNGSLDIYFNRSFDAGVTWLAVDQRLDTDLPGAAGSLIPRICCDGLSVYVVWYDERGGSADIYFNRSHDGGTTWLADDVRLDTDAAGVATSRDPQIVCVGTTLTVCWVDRRDGRSAIRATRSVDGGATWLPDDVRVDRAPASSDALTPQLVRSGMTTHVVWSDGRNGGSDIYISRSDDGGASWSASDTRLNEAEVSTGDAVNPTIAVEAAHVLVAWSDARSGAFDIHANRSLDAGTSWLAADVRIDRDLAGAADSLAPRVCLFDGRAAVVWEEHRAVRPDVYFSVSQDGGLSFAAFEQVLDTAPSALAGALRPQIAASPGGVLHAVWRDEADGRFDVRLRRSLDGGATWTATPVRLDTDDPGTGHSLGPVLCLAGETAHVVWHDQRDGPGDIYFNRVAFP